MCQALERAKLNFACSATGMEHLDNINLTAEQQQLLAKYRGTPLFETARDFIVNQQFRRDFFVKGTIKLSPEQREQKLLATAVVLAVPASDVGYTVGTRFGVANLKKEIYEPVLKFLDDHEAHTFEEVINALKDKDSYGTTLTQGQIFEALRTMTLLGTLQVAILEKALNQDVVKHCQDLNRELILKQNGSPFTFFASPVVQGGITSTSWCSN